MPSLHNTGPGLRIPINRQITLAWDKGATKAISEEHAAHPDVKRYIESGRLVVDAETRTLSNGLPSRKRGAGVTPVGGVGALPPRKSGAVQATPARTGRSRNPLPLPAVPNPADPITRTPLLVPDPVVSVIARPEAPEQLIDALVSVDALPDLDIAQAEGAKDPMPQPDASLDEDLDEDAQGSLGSDVSPGPEEAPAPESSPAEAAQPEPLPKTRRSRRA